MMIEKIYFDMDGVLADFDRGLAELTSVPIKDQSSRTEQEDNELWDGVRSVGHFYDKLEPMPGALEMFRTLYKKYGDKCEILTGVPKPKRNVPEAADDKRKWIERYFGPEVVVNITYAAEKKNYCKGKGYILIDDLERNIKDWTMNGGTAIYYKTPEETLKLISDIEARV